MISKVFSFFVLNTSLNTFMSLCVLPYLNRILNLFTRCLCKVNTNFINFNRFVYSGWSQSIIKKFYLLKFLKNNVWLWKIAGRRRAILFDKTNRVFLQTLCNTRMPILTTPFSCTIRNEQDQWSFSATLKQNSITITDLSFHIY